MRRHVLERADHVFADPAQSSHPRNPGWNRVQMGKRMYKIMRPNTETVIDLFFCGSGLRERVGTYRAGLYAAGSSPRRDGGRIALWPVGVTAESGDFLRDLVLREGAGGADVAAETPARGEGDRQARLRATHPARCRRQAPRRQRSAQGRAAGGEVRGSRMPGDTARYDPEREGLVGVAGG